MAILNCYISDDDAKLLDKIAEETHRDKTELAEAAISEAINNYFRHKPLNHITNGGTNDK